LNLSNFAVDVDGVFSNFSQAFIEQAVKMGFKDVFPTDWTVIPDWGFGVPPDIWQQVWNKIERDPDFWVKLPVMQRLSFSPLAYVTIRPLEHVTEAWLFKNQFPFAPVHVVTPGNSKVEILQKIGASAFIDDKYENYKEVKDAGIRSFLQDRPWNRHVDVGADRVFTIEQAMDSVLTQRHKSATIQVVEKRH
jgi:hypothetical protein